MPDTLETMVGQVRALASGPMWAMPGEALPQAVSQAHALADAATTLVAILTGEAADRGLPGEGGLSVADWVSAHAEGMDRRAAAAIGTVAPALRQPRWTALGEGVRAGAVTIGKAARIVRFEQDVSPIADAEHLASVVDSLVEHAATLDEAQIGRLTARARATLRPPADTERLERVQRAGRALTKMGSCAGMVEYRLRLDPEGAALLDAAIDPLARPRPDLDWDGGEGRDPRSAPCRRADALLDLVGRAMADPEGATRTEKTTLVVTMSLAALLGQITGAGVATNDAVLSAATVRRLACDAGVVPAVLGADGELLELGRRVRLFTPGQKRALALRDGGCTFPGCTIPPQWADAHHVEHWSRGGPTDLSNAALLCGRHHTLVHERDLTATVTATGVTWHT
jgi:hypothetical protein